MVVVAGPSGSGKTSRFPLAKFGVDYFNADNRAAELNAESFHGISKEIRSQVNLEFQRWILGQVRPADPERPLEKRVIRRQDWGPASRSWRLRGFRIVKVSASPFTNLIKPSFGQQWTHAQPIRYSTWQRKGETLG